MALIQLYDTTLRDGAQREGISLSVMDKLDIAQKLDELGIHFIEGGWPGSNPKDIEFFKRSRNLTLQNAQLVAFGSTRRPKARAEDDANILAIPLNKVQEIIKTNNKGKFPEKLEDFARVKEMKVEYDNPMDEYLLDRFDE